MKQTIFRKTNLYLTVFLLFATFYRINGQVSVSVGSAASQHPKIEQIGSKYQIRKSSGEIILSNIDSVRADKKRDIYIVKKNNKYGMLSNFGNTLIPLKFDKIERLFNQYWIVKLNNKYGVFSIYGKKILDTVYDNITCPKFIWVLNAEFTVKKGNKYGIYNSDGNPTVPIIYDKIEYKSIFVLTKNNENHFLIGNKIITKNILLNKMFKTHGRFVGDGRCYYVYQEGYKQGLIDDNGNILMTPKYDNIVPKNILSGDFLFVQNDNKWGAVNIKDSIIIPLKYESIDLANSKYLIIGINSMKQFYCLKNHNISDYEFERYTNSYKYSRIEKNGMATLIDNETMKMLFPYKYEDISYNNKGDCFTVKLNGKYGIINKEEKIMIPLIYDEYLCISCGGKVVAKKSGKYGIIDLNNKILFPFSDRYIIAYSDFFDIRNEKDTGTKEYDCDLNIIKK